MCVLKQVFTLFGPEDTQPFLLPQRIGFEDSILCQEFQLDFSLILLFLVKPPRPFRNHTFVSLVWIGLSSLSCLQSSLPSLCAVMPL